MVELMLHSSAERRSLLLLMMWVLMEVKWRGHHHPFAEIFLLRKEKKRVGTSPDNLGEGIG